MKIVHCPACGLNVRVSGLVRAGTEVIAPQHLDTADDDGFALPWDCVEDPSPYHDERTGGLCCGSHAALTVRRIR